MVLKRNIQVRTSGKKSRSVFVADLRKLKARVRPKVQRNKNTRLYLLLELYDRFELTPECTIALRFLTAKQQPLNDLTAAARYLEAEGSVFLQDNPEGYFVGLTHKGVKTVEKVYPACKGSEMDSEWVKIEIVDNHGQVQIGSHNSVAVSQNFGFDVKQVTSLLIQLRKQLAELPAIERRKGMTIVDGLERESESAAPQNSRMKALAAQLACFAVETAAKTSITDIIASLLKALKM